MSKRFWKTLAASVLGACLSCPMPAGAQTQPPPRSATLARDVNGFRLGMTVAEARSLAPLTFIGGDQFEAVTDEFEYNFGVTPRGRIYRVQSTQRLGHFAIDQQFIATLSRQLSEKYGKPTIQSGDNFRWNLVEPVTDATGQAVPFTTMWMTAHVGGSGNEQTLEITIIDFRILWTDEAAVNREPREAAEKRVQF